MLSIIIPSRNEKFLQRTIEDILEKAEGEIEIIAVLDGYWPDPELKENDRLVIIHKGTSQGMRSAINAGVSVAKGEFIMKVDGHCMFDKGFDLKILNNIEKNWIVIPRRKRLDAEKWDIKDVGKPDVDYEYLSYPEDPHDFGGAGLNGRIWTERILERANIDIDDTPASQGSCWVMHKEYFHELELMDDASFGPFWNESQELAFKCILSGGRYVVNKNTWYAHLHKGKVYGRGYTMDTKWLTQGRNFTMKFFSGQKAWHKQKYPLSYLIEKFMPMPTWDDAKLQELKQRENDNFK